MARHELKRWFPFQAMRLGYGLASEPAIACVDPTNQCRLLFARALKAEQAAKRGEQQESEEDEE